MSRLRSAAALVAATLVGLTAACSAGSGHPKAQQALSCSWSAAASAGALILSHDTLYAMDPTSGRERGHCTGHGIHPGAPTLAVQGEEYTNGYSTYVRPPVAGDVHMMPDNRTTADGSSTRGGVRELRTGTYRALSFPGWLVITAAGSRLLLEKDHVDDPEVWAAWCVLPAVTASRSSCARIRRPATAGSPAVAFDGTISWIPYVARDLRIGRLRGYAASDGRVIVAYGGSLPEDGRASLPVGMDEHTVVFPAGFYDGPTQRPTLQWATITPSGGHLHAVVHDSRVTGDGVDRRPELNAPDGEVQGSTDGKTIAVLSDTSHRVDEITVTGRMTTVRLQMPGSSPALQLVRWVFPHRPSQH